MNEAVKKVLEENIWYIATYDEEPNVVPVGFKSVSDDGKLNIAAVLLETTMNNIRKNGKIAIAACDMTTMEAYQIRSYSSTLFMPLLSGTHFWRSALCNYGLQQRFTRAPSSPIHTTDSAQ